MGLDNCKQVATPGVKKEFTNYIMDLPISDEHMSVNSLDERMPQVKFNDDIEIRSVPAYSTIYGCHAAKLCFKRMVDI